MEKELENQEMSLENKFEVEIMTGLIYKDICINCGGTMTHEGHCAYCPDCGYSLCSL